MMLAVNRLLTVAMLITTIAVAFAGYSYGVYTTKAKYDNEQLNKQRQALVTIARVQSDIYALYAQSSKNEVELAKHMSDIKRQLKTKPIVTAECKPTEHLVRALQDAIERSNQ